MRCRDHAILEILAKAYGSLTEVVRSQEVRLQKIEGRVEERAALLPPSAMDPRSRINKIVREGAQHQGIDFPVAWSNLYRDFGYRTHSSPTVAAKNRGMKILDYIEVEGQLNVLEAVALELYGVPS